MNEKSLYKLSCGLYIISSSYEDKISGCVANTLQQVTSSPIQFSITLNKENYTEQLIEKSGKFNAVVVSQNIDMDVIRRFGFQSGKDIDKYEGITHREDRQQIPYVSEHTCAYYTCKVVSHLDVGSHVIFVGEVVDMEVLSEEEVMTYAYYHQVKNGTTPKKASSYQEQTEKHGWRCSICGYLYEGEVLPQDYICPICGAPAAVFEKI
ncbi:flavin reductase [Longicatena caecimuris]|uniref:flavin reductase n=1 Tax=Longicatena caecimuris TaxID=1796635 RepID=UPI0039946EE7